MYRTLILVIVNVNPTPLLVDLCVLLDALADMFMFSELLDPRVQ